MRADTIGAIVLLALAAMAIGAILLRGER